MSNGDNIKKELRERYQYLLDDKDLQDIVSWRLKNQGVPFKLNNYLDFLKKTSDEAARKFGRIAERIRHK